MAYPRAHGTPGEGRVSVGDLNLMKRGTTLGAYRDGEPAGFLDAVWAVLNLTGQEIVVRVPHKLGRTPAWVKCWEVEDVNMGNPGDVGVASVNKSKWSATEIQVRIATSGCAGGFRVTLLVG